jgi:hypothetical protein
MTHSRRYSCSDVGRAHVSRSRPDGPRLGWSGA